MASSSTRRPDVPRNLKPYFLCLLKKGPQWNVTSGNEDLLPRHLAYMHSQVDAGHYVFAGPVTGEGDLIGMSVVRAATPAAAHALASADPGVVSGHFIVEVHPCVLPSLDAVRVEF